MTSRNFEFLRPARPELADLAAFAERYAFEDPVMQTQFLRLLRKLFEVRDLPRKFRNDAELLTESLAVLAQRGDLR